MRVTRHSFDAVYSSINASILSIPAVGPPATIQSLNVTDFYAPLYWILSPQSVDPSFVSGNSANEVLVNGITQDLQQYGDDFANSVYLLRTFMVTLLLQLQPNALNLYSSGPLLNSTATNLPPELYTTADIALVVGRIVIDEWTVIVYLAMALAIYFWCVAWLSWTVTIQKPSTTRFPLIDFASKAVAKRFTDGSLATILAEINSGDNESVKQKLSNTVVYIGDVDNNTVGERTGSSKKEIGKIGFSTMHDVAPLKPGELYE